MGTCTNCSRPFVGKACKPCRNLKDRLRYNARKRAGGDEHHHEDEPSVFPELSSKNIPRFSALADFIGVLGTCDETTLDHWAEVDLKSFAPTSMPMKERGRKVAELLREFTGIRWV
jgi:hypothetical protein